MTSHTSQTLERCSHNLGSAALPPCHILAEDKAGTTGRDHLGWMFRAQNGGKHGENQHSTGESMVDISGKKVVFHSNESSLS